ncbi:MAG: hypothetical protein ABJG68_17190 [Crocinitomicaceae bacterium]
MKTTVLLLMLTVAAMSMATEKDSTQRIDADFQSTSEVDPIDFSKFRLLDNPRKSRPLGVNLTAFGPAGLVSGSLDGYLTPNIALEGGAGIRNKEADVSYYVGARYHLFGKLPTRLTPYVGVYTAFHNEERDVSIHSFYVPVGLNRIKKNGFNWSIEAAYEKNDFKDGTLTGSFKIGYRF